MKSASKLARRTFGICELAEERCSSVCEWTAPKTDAIRRPLGNAGSNERAGANVTAETAIPAISEGNPRLRKHPLTRLDSRGRPKWTCSTLMLILLDHADLHIGSRESVCIKAAAGRSPSIERNSPTA